MSSSRCRSTTASATPRSSTSRPRCASALGRRPPRRRPALGRGAPDRLGAHRRRRRRARRPLHRRLDGGDRRAQPQRHHRRPWPSAWPSPRAPAPWPPASTPATTRSTPTAGRRSSTPSSTWPGWPTRASSPPASRCWRRSSHLGKADIVRRGAELGVPFAETWSCYKGGDLHCGTCGTCVERREAFELAGVARPHRLRSRWRRELHHRQAVLVLGVARAPRLGDDHPCWRLHGHNYEIEVICRGRRARRARLRRRLQRARPGEALHRRHARPPPPQRRDRRASRRPRPSPAWLHDWCQGRPARRWRRGSSPSGPRRRRRPTPSTGRADDRATTTRRRARSSVRPSRARARPSAGGPRSSGSAAATWTARGATRRTPGTGSGSTPPSSCASVAVDDVVDRVDAMGVDRVVVTGGEPLLQQRRLVPFLEGRASAGGPSRWRPTARIAPDEGHPRWSNRLNVSPKLANSGVAARRAASYPTRWPRSWPPGEAGFKFVVAERGRPRRGGGARRRAPPDTGVDHAGGDDPVAWLGGPTAGRRRCWRGAGTSRPACTCSSGGTSGGADPQVSSCCGERLGGLDELVDHVEHHLGRGLRRCSCCRRSGPRSSWPAARRPSPCDRRPGRSDRAPRSRGPAGSACRAAAGWRGRPTPRSTPTASCRAGLPVRERERTVSADDGGEELLLHDRVGLGLLGREPHRAAPHARPRRVPWRPPSVGRGRCRRRRAPARRRRRRRSRGSAPSCRSRRCGRRPRSPGRRSRRPRR